MFGSKADKEDPEYDDFLDDEDEDDEVVHVAGQLAEGAVENGGSSSAGIHTAENTQQESQTTQGEWQAARKVHPQLNVEPLAIEYALNTATLEDLGNDRSVARVWIPPSDSDAMVKQMLEEQAVGGDSDTDLVPRVYEGGMKLWEGGLDLPKYMCEAKLVCKDKRVLELGAGHGLPGMVALLDGAAHVSFADYNEQVLQSVTFPTALCNLAYANGSLSFAASQALPDTEELGEVDLEEEDVGEENGGTTNQDDASVDALVAQVTERCHFYSGSWSSLNDVLGDAQYDLILSAETLYSRDSYAMLHDLLDTHLASSGQALFAAKIFYFGVGGGARDFAEYVRQRGVFDVAVVKQVTGSGSIERHILRLTRPGSSGP